MLSTTTEAGSKEQAMSEMPEWHSQAYYQLMRSFLLRTSDDYPHSLKWDWCSNITATTATVLPSFNTRIDATDASEWTIASHPKRDYASESIYRRLHKAFTAMNQHGRNGNTDNLSASSILKDMPIGYFWSRSEWNEQDIMLTDLVRSLEAHKSVQSVYTRRFRKEWHVHILLYGDRLSRDLIDEMLDIEYTMRTEYDGTIFDFSYYPAGKDGKTSSLEPSAIKLYQR